MSRTADGGTAGGSADDSLLPQSRPSTFQFLVVVVLKVFTVFSQARVLCSALVSRSLTLQFVVVELLEVFKVLSQDKVPVVGGMDFLPIFMWQLSRRFCRESRNKVFFRTFPLIQKSAPAATLPSARVHGHSSSSELSAHQIPRAGDPRDTLEDFFTNEAGMWMRLPTGRWYLLCSDPAVYYDEPG